MWTVRGRRWFETAPGIGRVLVRGIAGFAAMNLLHCETARRLYRDCFADLKTLAR